MEKRECFVVGGGWPLPLKLGIPFDRRGNILPLSAIKAGRALGVSI